MGAAERVDLWVRGCSDARRRPMGLPGARLRRGLGLPSSFGGSKINSVSSVSLASMAQAYLFFGILRHPTALEAKGIAHSILETGPPQRQSVYCVHTPGVSFAAAPACLDAAKDARRPAHPRRGPLAPALHFCNTAPALPARIEALPAPVRAPPTRSGCYHTWFALPVTCTPVPDEFGRPDGPGGLARGKRHGRPHPEARREK